MENSTANHYMDDQENFGLCDETLEMFQEFMAMAIVTTMYPRIDLECSICMNILARPHQLEDCFHVFCEVCLIRLFLASQQTSELRCPLCRAEIQRTWLLIELDMTLMNYFEEYCHYRMDMEIEVYHQLGGFTRTFQDLLDLNYREDFAGFEIDPETPDRGFVVYDRVYLNQACKSDIIQLQSQEKQT